MMWMCRLLLFCCSSFSLLSYLVLPHAGIEAIKELGALGDHDILADGSSSIGVEVLRVFLDDLAWLLLLLEVWCSRLAMLVSSEHRRVLARVANR